jgi:hypothetical protein
MEVKTGLEIVDLYRDYDEKIREIEDAVSRLMDYEYTKNVLQSQLARLRAEMKSLETTRFQPLEPVTVVKSSLGGHDYYLS